MKKTFLTVTIFLLLVSSLSFHLYANNQNRDSYFQLVNSNDYVYSSHQVVYYLNKDGSRNYQLRSKHENPNYYKQDVYTVVNSFYSNYIDGKITKGEKDWMFKCEMEIIKFLEKKVKYATERYESDKLIYEDYTAYGALVKGEAVCSGYSRAFVALARRCGLEAYIVHSNTHAWNVIKLDDGEYYNVDVTWNDDNNNPPTEQANYNRYINLTNDMLLLRDTEDHSALKNFEFDCNAYEYGPEKVELYLQD